MHGKAYIMQIFTVAWWLEITTIFTMGKQSVKDVRVHVFNTSSQEAEDERSWVCG